MARTPQDVTDRELELLQVLWDSGAATIRQLTDAIYPGGGPAQYGTVQKLLERLEGKGFVQRDRTPAAHTFTPTLGREDLIGRSLNELAEKLCGGSLTPLLTHLVRTKKMSQRERQELRDLIDELDTKGKGKKGSR